MRRLQGILILSRLLAAEPAASSITDRHKENDRGGQRQVVNHKTGPSGSQQWPFKLQEGHDNVALLLSLFFSNITGMSHSITNSYNFLNTQTQYKTKLKFLWKPSKIVVIILFPKAWFSPSFLNDVTGIKYLYTIYTTFSPGNKDVFQLRPLETEKVPFLWWQQWVKRKHKNCSLWSLCVQKTV